jgi:hypothetical protein
VRERLLRQARADHGRGGRVGPKYSRAAAVVIAVDGEERQLRDSGGVGSADAYSASAG